MLSKATLYCGKTEREGAAESDLPQVAMCKGCKEEAMCVIHQCELEDREEEGTTKSNYVREDYGELEGYFRSHHMLEGCEEEGAAQSNCV